MAVPAQMQQYQYQHEQATRRPETDKMNQVQTIMSRYGTPQNPLSPGGKQSAIPTYAQNTGAVAPMGGGYAPASAGSAWSDVARLQQYDKQSALRGQEWMGGNTPVTPEGFGSTWSPYDPMKQRSYRIQQAVGAGPVGGPRKTWHPDWERMSWLDRLKYYQNLGY